MPQKTVEDHLVSLTWRSSLQALASSQASTLCLKKPRLMVSWLPCQNAQHTPPQIACVAGAWKQWAKERTGMREGDTQGVRERLHGRPLPSRVSFSRTRFFLCPLLASACYAGYASEGRFELAGRRNAHRVERKNITWKTVFLKALLETFILMLKPERLANVILELIMK